MNKKSSKPLRIKIPKTVSQSVYKYLKQSIIENKLIPGQKINEQDIADIFQVSRTPVREAITQLAAEELVQVDPHHGAEVKKVTFEEMNDILEVIRVLDELAIEQAAANIGAQDLRKLTSLNNRMKRVYQNRDIEIFLDLNLEFHKKIWSFVSNDFLRENLHSCLAQLRRFRRYLYSLEDNFQDHGFLNKMIIEHKKILFLLGSKEKKDLRSIVTYHWRIENPSTFIKKDLSEIQ